jgi:Ca2+-binding RTX toxin-like protein
MATVRRLAAIVAILLGSVVPTASAEQVPPYLSGPAHDFGEMVDYPLAFPLGGPYTMFDSFYSPRCCGDGVVHHAQDLMADKMTPVYAAASGTISYVNWTSTGPPDPERCCTIALRHDDGWESWYIHLNNDTPGTDDGQGWGIAPGIEVGVHVEAGQLIGWVGDSGNAEDTDSHLHFELHDPFDVYVNPYQALLDADAGRGLLFCDGQAATIVGSGTIIGTDGDDVIIGSVDADVIDAGAGNDTICAFDGVDVVDGGPGDDRIFGGRGNDRLSGGEGGDTLIGDAGHDRLLGGPGDDDLSGGPGGDMLIADEGNDMIRGDGGKDRIRSGIGANTVSGGPGRDLIDYRASSEGVMVDLEAGTGGADALSSIERIRGSDYSDILEGDSGPNTLKGGAGDDQLAGREGNDRLLGLTGNDSGDGGAGFDICVVETPTDCEG